MKSVTSLGHVAIRVADIDKTLEFYTKKLGFSEMMRIEEGGELLLIYLRITDAQYLEVFPNARGDRAPSPEANGLNHLCLTVKSLDAALEELGDLGIPLYRNKRLGADGNWQAWIEDPDGNRIEFMEMAPGCMQFDGVRRLGGTVPTDL